jgi:hypothetical protein
MTVGTVVLAGVLPVEHVALDLLVAEFGWSLREASSIAQVAELNATNNLVTVLFSPQDLALPWDQALRALLRVAPEALPILCHGFADAIDWPQLAEAGVFHSLLLPFDMGEVRQSLGFVRQAKLRQAATATRDLQELEKAVKADVGENPEFSAEAPMIVPAKTG